MPREAFRQRAPRVRCLDNRRYLFGPTPVAFLRCSSEVPRFRDDIAATSPHVIPPSKTFGCATHDDDLLAQTGTQ